MLDSLKGLSIIGITCIHTGMAGLSGVTGRIGDLGGHAVQLFFIISSFLAYLSLDREFDGAEPDIKSVFKWWIKKLIRIVPTFYFAIFVRMILGMGGFPFWYGDENAMTFGNLTTHFGLLFGLFPRYCNSILGGEWYLGVLIIFYLIVPYIYRYINSLYKAFASFIVITYISNIIVGLMRTKLVPDNSLGFIYDKFFYNYSIIPELPILLVGIIIYYLWKDSYLEKIEHKTLMSMLLLFMALVIIRGQMYGYNNIYRVSEFVIFGLAFAMVIISQMLYRIPIIDNKFFRWIGRYSYGIYIFQFVIINLYDMYFHIDINHEIIKWFIKFIICFTVLTLLSLIVSYTEKLVISKIKEKHYSM